MTNQDSWRFDAEDSKRKAEAMSDAELQKALVHHLNYVHGSSHLHVLHRESERRKQAMQLMP